MQLPQRLIQGSTLVFFACMVTGFVLFRSGVLKKHGSFISGFSGVERDSVPPPGFDSIRFRNLVYEIENAREKNLLNSTKSGPVFNSGKKEDAIDWASVDTASLLDVLGMRRELARLDTNEAAAFQKLYTQTLRHEGNRFLKWLPYLPEPMQDSVNTWLAFKYSPKPLLGLSAEEQQRFGVILDSLLTPEISSTKSAIVFPYFNDTIRALRILESERAKK